MRVVCTSMSFVVGASTATFGSKGSSALRAVGVEMFFGVDIVLPPQWGKGGSVTHEMGPLPQT